MVRSSFFKSAAHAGAARNSSRAAAGRTRSEGFMISPHAGLEAVILFRRANIPSQDSSVVQPDGQLGAVGAEGDRTGTALEFGAVPELLGGGDVPNAEGAVAGRSETLA